MDVQIFWAMVLVTTAFRAVVARDIPHGPDLELDDFMISGEKNVMDYWNNTKEKTSVLTYSSVSCSCGIANTKNRIIDGIEVNPKRKYPWQVGLRPGKPGKYYFKCGGSIINNRYVLTAAHCVYDNDDTCNYNPLQNLSVQIGEHDLNDESDDGELILVKQIIIHPSYNCRNTQNDFTLLELNNPIEFNDDIRPVCLPEDDSKTYAGEMATVAGWGYTKYKGSNSLTLLEVDVTILDNNNCGNYEAGKITVNMICAGDLKNGGKNTCNGDSGGPLVVKDGKSKYVQVGIVSFAEKCALKDFATVFARVSKVLDWIKEKSASGQYCAN